MRFAVHFNSASKWQQRWSTYLVRGFQAHGHAAFRNSGRRRIPETVAVGLGLHYFRDVPDLLIDRAFWGDPDSVRISVLRDGKRLHAMGVADRPRPTKLAPRAQGRGVVMLPTYGEDPSSWVEEAREHFDTVLVRRHPAERKRGLPVESFESLALRAGVAMGTTSTALAAAALAGIAVISPCEDYQEITTTLARPQLPCRAGWLHRLSYQQFHYTETVDGTAWELLKHVHRR